jgi:hypothetical protein
MTMIKPMKILAWLPLAALMALTGCEDSGNTSLEGTWQASKLGFTDASGAGFTESLPDGWAEVLVLNPDGSFSYSSTQAGKTATGTGRWGLEGSDLVLAQQKEQAREYRIDGDELALSGAIPEGAYSLYWMKIAEAE